MNQVIVAGYASLDYALLLETPARPGWTSRILSRSREQWPRPGGCPYYVANAMAQDGLAASVVTWIGDDAMGNVYRQQCQSSGIGIGGIGITEGGSTLTSILAYQQDGDCACLVDFGNVDMQASTRQLALAKAAQLACFTVGPPEAGLALLQAVRDDAAVAWVAKNDAESFPQALRRQLGQRAQYIFCNAAERPWIDEAIAGRPTPPLIVQTNGEQPVLLDHGGQTAQVPVQPLVIADATGAGDTLAGATLAALVRGCAPPAAVAAGCSAAHALLSHRDSAP